MILPLEKLWKFKILFLHAIIISACSTNTSDTITERVGYEYEEIDSLVSYAWKSIKSQEYHGAIKALDKSISLSNGLNDTLGLSNSLSNYGALFYYQGILDSSLVYYRLALKLDREIGDSSRLVRRLKNIGISLRSKGSYNESLSYYLQALKIAEEINSIIEIASLSNAIGNLYNEIDEPERAKPYLNKALNFWTEGVDSVRMAVALNNLGNSYFGTNQFGKALANYQWALKIKKVVSSQKSLAHTYTNLGELFLVFGSLERSEFYLQKSLNIREKIDDQKGIALVLNNLGKLRWYQNQRDEAWSCLNRSRDLSIEKEYSDMLLENYKLRKEFCFDQGDYAEAYLSSVKYDSLNNIDFQINKIEALRLQSDFDLANLEKEKKISDQKLVISGERNSRQKLLLYTSLLIIVLVFIILILLFRSRKTVRIKNEILNERNLLIKTQKDDISHRLQNSLGRVRFLLREVGEKIEDDYVIHQLKRGENMVMALSTLEDFLQGSEENSKIELRPYIEKLANHVISSFSTLNKPIAIEFKLDQVSLPSEQIVPLSLIISEILTNAMKYSFEKVEQPLIAIRANVNNQMLTLTIKDNGIGFDLKTNSEGQGLILIRKFADYLKADLQTNNQSGLEYILIFSI